LCLHEDLIAPEQARSLIDRLNELGGGYVLVWLLSGAEEELRPPDQIVGWLPPGAFTRNGTSDPYYFRGGLGVSLVANDDAGERGSILAHEIAHNLGLNHPDDTPPVWPYRNVRIQEYGFDVEEMAVRSTSQRDLMQPDGNESDNWISPFSFGFLFDGNLRQPLGAARAARSIRLGQGDGENESVLISGRVYSDGRGELEPIYRVPATGSFPGLPPGTGYCLDFLDGLGQQLRRRCFDLAFESADGPTDHAGFLLLEPYPPATARIRLVRGTASLDQRVVSPHGPQVAVLTPNGGEQWDGVQTIAWQASDADSDPLTYSVFYSLDDGRSWRLVGTGLTAQQVHWDTSQFGGGKDARVRVIVTDGFNTASDDSDGAFQIRLKAPTARIASPEGGTTFQRPEAVLLVGRGVDLEDGELRGGALVWSSDRDGVLGTGGHIVTPELSRGRHVITLTATDSDTTSGVASVAIEVATAMRIPECAGDCSRDAAVTVDELLILVNVALGNTLASACLAGDADHNGQITIDEVLTAVNHALNGCAAASGPDN
jgi:hypothetical protein